MAGTARPTSTMKAFVVPLIPPPPCDCIVLDRLCLVGLYWLGVSSMTVGNEADSELSVSALGSHRYYPKLLELFPSRHGWHSSLTLFQVKRMASHPKVPTSPSLKFFILHISSSKCMGLLPWTLIWSFFKWSSTAGSPPVRLLFLGPKVTSLSIVMEFTIKLAGMEPVRILTFKYNSRRMTKLEKGGRVLVSLPE